MRLLESQRYVKKPEKEVQGVQVIGAEGPAASLLTCSLLKIFEATVNYIFLYGELKVYLGFFNTLM